MSIPRFIQFSVGVVLAGSILGPSLVSAEGTVTLNPPSSPLAVTAPTLSFTRTVSDARVSVPGEFTITDVVKNIGTVPASAVTVTQPLPSGWSVNGQDTFEVQIGTLAAGQTATRSHTITVSATSASGRYSNEATVSATGTDPLMATAPVDLTRGRVLGAATLAPSGQSPMAFLIGGLVVFLSGLVIFARRTR